VLGRNTASVTLTFRAVKPEDAEKVKLELKQQPTQDLYSELEKLEKLKKEGVLTEEEFQEQKKKLLEHQ
jgi:hypothetical protein